MILQQSGIPIYSKCFGEFCYLLVADENLFSGFLAALTSMPKMMSEDQHALQSVEMSHTKLVFDYTTPSGNVIVLGFDPDEIDSDAKKVINEMFVTASEMIETKYSDYNWSAMSDEKFYTFEHDLINTAIKPYYSYPEDQEDHEGQCPLCIATSNEMKVDYQSTVWDKIKSVYSILPEYFKTDEGKVIEQESKEIYADWSEKAKRDPDTEISRIKDL